MNQVHLLRNNMLHNNYVINHYDPEAQIIHEQSYEHKVPEMRTIVIYVVVLTSIVYLFIFSIIMIGKYLEK
jgi:hypothetical protein